MLLPNKLFEYLMAGLPVLASQLDAVAEVIKTCDVGWIVPSLAPADVGAEIWDREKRRLIRFYHDICASHITVLSTPVPSYLRHRRRYMCYRVTRLRLQPHWNGRDRSKYDLH